MAPVGHPLKPVAKAQRPVPAPAAPVLSVYKEAGDWGSRPWQKGWGRERSLMDFYATVLKSHAMDTWVNLQGGDDVREQVRTARKRLERVYETEYTSAGKGWSIQLKGYHPVTKSPMNESASGTAGGYLLPVDFTTRMMKTIDGHSVIYPRADVYPMTTRELPAPTVDAETASGTAGVPSYFGGTVFKWGSEQAPAETEPKFRQVILTAWDLLGYSVLSRDFFQDTGPAGEQALLNLLGRAAAWYLEYAFLQGSGAAQSLPLGILNAPAAKLVTRKTGSQIQIADVVSMTSALLPYSWYNAVWMCSPTALAQIQQITQYFINVELGAAGLGEMRPKPAGVLSTLPLFITDKLPAMGTKGDLILIDPTLYVVGMRQDVLVDVSEHTLFQTNQVVMRTWLRADGKPRLASSITLQDQTTVVSPFVILN